MGVGVRGGDRRDGVALLAGGRIGRRSRSTLRAFSTVSGAIRSSRDGRGVSLGVSATVRTPPPPPRAAAAAASLAAASPSGVRSEVCAKPVVSPRTTRSPAPRSRPETSSSTRPSSYRAFDERRSSTNTSAKSPPSRNAWSSVVRERHGRSSDGAQFHAASTSGLQNAYALRRPSGLRICASPIRARRARAQRGCLS